MVTGRNAGTSFRLSSLCSKETFMDFPIHSSVLFSQLLLELCAFVHHGWCCLPASPSRFNLLSHYAWMHECRRLSIIQGKCDLRTYTFRSCPCAVTSCVDAQTRRLVEDLPWVIMYAYSLELHIRASNFMTSAWWQDFRWAMLRSNQFVESWAFTMVWCSVTCAWACRVGFISKHWRTLPLKLCLPSYQVAAMLFCIVGVLPHLYPSG